MTEVLAGPIAERIVKEGGSVTTNAKATALIVADNHIQGVRINDQTDYHCDYVIMAAPLGPAHQIVRASGLESTFPELLSLPSMPEVNLQLEFKRPAWPVDHTVFGVGTSLITFTEQSRTTFRNKTGRLSIILTPPNNIIDMADEDIFGIFERDAPKLGIGTADVTDYRVIKHPADFYLLSPGMNKLRPQTKTSVQGLFLAGDYVRQSFMATMEGAVITGNNAANEVIRSSKGNH
jgi:15-cis-phytoene desaturase